MTHVGRYRILEELGRGAMGVVYKALDPSIGRTVAIKAIRLNDFQDSGERERIHQRLWNEAQSAGVLSHPNIVTIFDVVEHETAAFIVMEYVGGPSLGHLFRRGHLPPHPELLQYFRQVAEALDYAHQKGVVHRDVKPGNIIIAPDRSELNGLAKVADFGVAKFISQDTTHSGTMIGTPNYMSPEQIEGLNMDGRSDQFSLAVVTYEMLTGQKPFDSANLAGLFYQICKQSPKPVDQLNPLLPSMAGKVLQRGMAKEQTQRFSTCGEMISALILALGTAPERLPVVEPRPAKYVVPAAVTSVKAGPSESRHVWKRSPRVAVFAGAAAVLLGAAVALFWTNTHESLKPSVRPSQPSTKAAVNVIHPEKPHQRTPDPPKAGLGEVLLTTEPAGATVVVDEQSNTSCVAPCGLRLRPGRHTLTAAAQGFNLAKRIFHVPDDRQLAIALQASMGVLLITSDPSGSEISVDGRPSGRTPVSLRLTAGPHELAFSNGEQRHAETIVIQSDEFASRNLRWQ